MRRLAVLPACLLCSLAPPFPVAALSSAEQSVASSIRLVSATYVLTGLDAGDDLSIEGHYYTSWFQSFEGGSDATGTHQGSASHNGAPLAPFYTVALRVDDVLRASQTTAVRASTPDTHATWGHTIEWEFEAASPLLDDVALEFAFDAGSDFALRNDTEESWAEVSLDGYAALYGASGNPEDWALLGTFAAEHHQTGSVGSPDCDSFCGGEFEPPGEPPVLILRRSGTPSILRLHHHAQSAVELGPLPEPSAGLGLLAGVALLAALPRRR